MVDKRPIGVISGKADYLEKKVPKNPKYSHVSSSIKTGTHVNHVEVISDSNIAKRKGELFRRIKPATLAGLLKEEKNGESIYHLVDQANPGESAFGDQTDTQSVYSAFTSKTGYTEASKFSSITSATQQLLLGDNSEFLLLDLREPEDYELYHIKEAVSYPAPNLGRDKVIPELFKFKNKEGKIIIIYHTDERNGVTYGNLMAQKNYENVYLLTGGIESFLEDLTQHLEGKKVPVPLKQEKKKQIVYKRSNYEADPDRNTINIPSQHIEDDSKSVISNNKSMISNATKASGMSGISKTTTKTHQSKYSSGTFGRTERKL